MSIHESPIQTTSFAAIPLRWQSPFGAGGCPPSVPSGAPLPGGGVAPPGAPPAFGELGAEPVGLPAPFMFAGAIPMGRLPPTISGVPPLLGGGSEGAGALVAGGRLATPPGAPALCVG